MVLSVSSAVGDTVSSKLSVAPTGVELHSSRYSIPRTLPYFANFKSQTVSYKQYCDVEGGYRKQRLHRQCVNGNRLHVRGHVVEKKQEVQGKGLTRDRSSGTVNLKSISVNDLLDQHLSKLTLGGIKSASSSRTGQKTKSERPNKSENPLMDSGSDDSMLIRQVMEIEKGTMLRKKRSGKQLHLDVLATKRAPLEPSIVTLVHTSSPPREATSPDISLPDSYRECSSYKDGAGSVPSYRDGAGSVPSHRDGAGSVPSYRDGAGSVPSYRDGAGSVPSHRDGAGSVPSYRDGAGSVPSYRDGAGSVPSHPPSVVNSEHNESYSLDQLAQQEALIPDCTTVNSPFVRQQPRSNDTPAQIYQREKLGLQPPRPLLCQKVRYSSCPRKKRTKTSTNTSIPANRVGENPSTRCKTPNIPQHSQLNKRKKKRPKSKTQVDPMKGFGPWVAEHEDKTCINTVINVVPQIKINIR